MNASSPTASTIPGIDSMQADRSTPLPLAPVRATAVFLDFAGGRLSSDAGLVRLKDPDEQLGFTRALAPVLSAPRATRRVTFTQHDWLKPRGFQSAAGDEDANDANTRRHAPLCTLRLDRLPETGAPLASHPTRSRVENRVSRPALYRLALVVVEQCIAAYRRPPQVIGLAFDATAAPVQGDQDQARYAGYAGGDCVLPLHLYEGRSGRLRTSLRKAQRCPGQQRLAVWQRVVKRRRHAWPPTRRSLRGESHFASPAVMQWSEEPPDRSYVTGLTGHPVFKALACQGVEQATRAYARDGGKSTRCHATRSQAGTWSRSRRVGIKGAVCDHGVTPRFVVTAREHARPTGLSQPMYCARGQAGNDLQDPKLYLNSARTSWHRFEAKQFRLLWHAAADV